MLLFFGILFVTLGIICAALIAFANGMSDSPYSSVSFTPALVFLIVGVILLVLHHFLHGMTVSW